MRMWAAFPETLHGTWDEQLLPKASGAKWLSPMQCSDRRLPSCLRILFFKYRKHFHISSSWSLFEAKSCIFQIRTEAFLGKATLEQTVRPSSPRWCSNGDSELCLQKEILKPTGLSPEVIYISLQESELGFHSKVCRFIFFPKLLLILLIFTFPWRCLLFADP